MEEKKSKKELDSLAKLSRLPEKNHSGRGGSKLSHACWSHVLLRGSICLVGLKMQLQRALGQACKAVQAL